MAVGMDTDSSPGGRKRQWLSQIMQEHGRVRPTLLGEDFPPMTPERERVVEKWKEENRERKLQQKYNGQ